VAFQRILALTDLSECSCLGLALAETLARRLHSRVTVGFVQTRADGLAGLGGDDDNAQRLREWVRKDDEEQLQRLSRKYVDRLRLEGTETVERPSAREGVAALIERARPDLVCMATHGRTGFRHMLLGSVAEHTIRTARVPVIVTKGSPVPAPGEPLRVMVTLDLLDEPEPIVRAAAGLLSGTDALLVAHAVESIFFSPAAYGVEIAFPQPDAPALREAAQRRLEAVDPGPGLPRPEVRIATGRPGEALVGVEKEWHPHVVVARTHGRRGFDRMMLGSVSEFLARRCTAAVLVFPKP
jgi:nucleotide-binding universal stress UspA family protein